MLILQKHERQALAVIREVADSYKMVTEVLPRSGKHPVKIRVTSPCGTKTAKRSLSSSPKNADHMVVNFRKQMIKLFDQWVDELSRKG